ncbi:MAG: hypothetical protein FJX60_22805 [Alphaproteobacteria bacterium]|nr:hypothetical protein [Alphaproteobacteria bacterium]
MELASISQGPIDALRGDPDLMLFTKKEYAKLRRCSERVVEREQADGSGCKFVKLGRKVFFRLSDIRAHLASRLRQSTSEAT